MAVRCMRVLVTGANGFIGSSLCRSLVEKGYKVVGMVRKTSNLQFLKGISPIELREGDLSDKDGMRSITKGISVIYHIAAYTSDWGHWQTFEQANITGVKNLFEAAKSNNIKKVVHLSTVSVYGFPGGLHRDEQTPLALNPKDPYSYSKAVGENIALSFSSQGLNVTVIRPAGVYGPNDRTTSLKLIPLLLKRSFGFVDKGKHIMAPLFIDNLIQAIQLAGENYNINGQAYNIADDGFVTWRQYIDWMCEDLKCSKQWLSVPGWLALPFADMVERCALIVKKKDAPIVTKYRINAVLKDNHYSAEKAKRELGYRPGVSTREGIRRTVKWYFEYRRPSMSKKLEHTNYYRMPWSYSDNIISWLEPTTKCNLTCEGCYRENTAADKSLEEIRADLDLFKRLRKSDCISIAGGDPLVHPHIVDIVRMVKEMGWKPIVNTNGIALDRSLLLELKRAGVYGFTFHIDTSQKRPGIAAKTETELNDTRLYYAKMLAGVGGIACSFNSTVTEKNLKEIPEISRWAQRHADIVHTMVFILYRSPSLTGKFDFLAKGKRVDFGDAYKESTWGGGDSIYASDMVTKLREGDPRYEPSAYLNGTAGPDSIKWLIANRIVLDGKTMGYVSPKFMELVQTLNHIFTGRYLSYINPALSSKGKIASFLAGLFDSRMRKIFLNSVAHILSKPSSLFKPAYSQSILIIQPINIEPDGRQDMCDACPDVTVYKGQLVWSCRLEEMNKFGTFVTSVPAEKVKEDKDCQKPCRSAPEFIASATDLSLHNVHTEEVKDNI